jgi:hypothetical protein
MRAKNLSFLFMLLFISITMTSCHGKKETLPPGDDYMVVVSWNNLTAMKPVTNSVFELYFSGEDDCSLISEGFVEIKSGEAYRISGKGEVIFKTSKPTRGLLVKLRCESTNFMAQIHLYVYKNGILEDQRTGATHTWRPNTDRLIIDVNDPLVR